MLVPLIIENKLCVSAFSEYSQQKPLGNIQRDTIHCHSCKTLTTN